MDRQTATGNGIKGKRENAKGETMRLFDEYTNSPSAHFPNRNFFDEYMNSLDARLPHLIISKPKQEPPARADKIERIMPEWDKETVIVRYISETIFGKGATAANIALVKSMLPLYTNACITYLKGKRHSVSYDIAAIADRLKHRQKIAKLHGQTLAIFENDRIDESTKADDLALLTALCNRTNNAPPNTPTGKPRRERAKGMSNKSIAAEFNRYAAPLIRKVIRNNGDNADEISAIAAEAKRKGIKFAMLQEYGGLCFYEPKRGGDHSGIKTVGNCTEDTIESWIKKYPDESKPEPKSGFHAGMLTDKAAIEKAAKRRGEYYREYAIAFFHWRELHPHTPFSHFRYTPTQTQHGGEKRATTQAKYPD